MRDSSFDLNLLRVLNAIFECRSVSAAATQLGLTQSATSHALARLREEFADPLFVRTSEGMQPTPYAEQISLLMRQPLEELRLTLGAGRKFDPANSSRVFSLYLSDVGQLVLLPRLLAYLAVHAPGIRLQIRTLPSIDPQSALERGEVDLAVGYITTLTAGFFQKLLFREHYVCVVRADHPRFADGMSLDAFQAVPHAIADSTGMAHAALDRFLAEQGIVRNVQLRVPHFMVLPIIIAGSDVLVTMPSRLAREFSSLVSIKVLPLPIAYESYDIRTYWQSRYHTDPGNIWLRRTIAAIFSDSEGLPDVPTEGGQDAQVLSRPSIPGHFPSSGNPGMPR